MASSINFRFAAKVLGGGIECPDGAQALSGAAAMPPKPSFNLKRQAGGKSIWVKFFKMNRKLIAAIVPLTLEGDPRNTKCLNSD